MGVANQELKQVMVKLHVLAAAVAGMHRGFAEMCADINGIKTKGQKMERTVGMHVLGVLTVFERFWK